MKSLKMIVKRIDKLNIIKNCYFFVLLLIRKIKWRKRKLNNHGGNNPDKIFYVIRRERNVVPGLFSYFLVTLSHLSYIKNKGMVPVIDMKNYPNTYLLESEVGKVNAWEYYFKQPTEYSLEEAMSSKHIILSSGIQINKSMPNFTNKDFYLDINGKLTYWKQLCKKYIHLSNEVIERLSNEKRKLFYGKEKILGVSFRGSDYNAIKSHNHPIQPSIEMVMSKIDEAINDNSFNYIYLTIDERKTAKAFKEKYKDRIILMERDLPEYSPDKEKYITNYISKNNSKYMQGLEYLVSILLLEECDGLILNIAGGTAGFMCLSEKKFEYLYVFDLGLYP